MKNDSHHESNHGPSSILQRGAFFRRRSPLCLDSYRAPHEALPPALPPKWLYRGLWVSFFLTLLLALGVLLSAVDEFVSAPGVVRPGDYTLVFSPTSGLLESISVEDGAEVQPGDILARLDTLNARRELSRLESAQQQTQVELALARSTARKISAVPVPTEFLFSGVEVHRQREIRALQRDYLSRLEELEKSGAASGVELLNLRLQLIATEALLQRSEQAQNLLEGEFGQAAAEEARERVRLAESRLEALTSELAFQKEEIERAVIRSPREGQILAATRIFPGERVEAGAALFKIAHGGPTELRLYASEDRIDRIQPGQHVRFRANNNPDRLAPMATGKVVAVARDLDLENDQLTAPIHLERRFYRVTVRVEDAPYPLAVGASVQAEIVLGRRPFWRLLFLPGDP